MERAAGRVPAVELLGELHRIERFVFLRARWLLMDDADRAEENQAVRLRALVEQRSAAIADALAPAGVNECADCDEPIGEARLRAAPWARRCIDCQELHEWQALFAKQNGSERHG